jgi:serine/threonine protein kinase
MRDLIGRTLGHYRIVDKIGEGGMGEVYRAHDERLDRDVAIKVLPESVAADPDRLRRFEREAKAVAALSHPNILEIFDFDTEGDVTYAVTELLEGDTLRKRLGEGALPWRRAVEISASIAHGLAAAHAEGIVHRDLKPENVFLTADNRVKVLDFGLAKVEEGPIEELDTVTSPSPGTVAGTVLGTIGYMAPEQVRGESADSRSDIFALGCVLYEMVTDRAPFRRDTTVETMAAILSEEPSDLRPVIGDLPPSMDSIIRRCLEKQPDARFQTGQDLAFALRSTLKDDSGPITHATLEEKSIVVLPFDNLSPDPDQEYFSEGLTEEVISDLAKVRALRVISRTSAMQLKGTEKDLRTIGRELNVGYVLEGSVRRAGNALRITAQLIDALTDTHLWSEKYTGTLDDVFDIQENVSRSIVDALEVKLTPQEKRGIAERPAENLQAYEVALRARREIQTLAEAGIRRAIRDLESATKVIGENAELFYLLGEAYLYCKEFGIEVDGGAVHRAEEFARSILRIDSGSSKGHHLLGRIERFRGSALEGIRHFERAFAIDPNSPDTLFWLALGYGWQAGRPKVAVRLAKKLIAIDPLATTSYFILGLSTWMNGDLDQAMRSFEKVVEMEPENTLVRMWIAFVLMWKGEFEQAFELADQIALQQQTDSISSWNSDVLEFARCAIENKPEQAMAAMSETTTGFFWEDPDVSWLIAGIYSVMDHSDEAIRWLEHAIDRGSINYPLFAGLDPFYENLRRDDRFQKLMDKIKPEWERFEVGIDLSSLPPASDDR